MAQLGNMFSTVSRATKKAVDGVDKLIGQPTDPDLRLYDSLQMNDFDAIAKEFGTDKTIEYIQKMESRKMIGGKNANA